MAADYLNGWPVMKTRTLDQVRVAASQVIDRAVRDVVENPWGHLEYRLASYVLADQLVKDPYTVTLSYTVPSSWWQFFKTQHGHRWWLRRWVRRWPVETVTQRRSKTVTFDRRATYPQARINFPDLGPAVIAEQLHETDWIASGGPRDFPRSG